MASISTRPQYKPLFEPKSSNFNQIGRSWYQTIGNWGQKTRISHSFLKILIENSKVVFEQKCNQTADFPKKELLSSQLKCFKFIRDKNNKRKLRCGAPNRFFTGKIFSRSFILAACQTSGKSNRESIDYVVRFNF